MTTKEIARQAFGAGSEYLRTQQWELPNSVNFETWYQSINPPEDHRCDCGHDYISEKKSDISYDIEGNTMYTDIYIYYCPKCGNIDRIEEF